MKPLTLYNSIDRFFHSRHKLIQVAFCVILSIRQNSQCRLTLPLPQMCRQDRPPRGEVVYGARDCPSSSRWRRENWSNAANRGEEGAAV